MQNIPWHTRASEAAYSVLKNEQIGCKTENEYKNKDFLRTNLADLIADIVFALVGIDTTGPGWLLAGGAIALSTSPSQPVNI